MSSLITIMISALITQNYVLSKTFGICPFLGVSKKMKSAVGMGFAVTFVMVCATAVTYPVYNFLLKPNDLAYLRTVSFILIIALFVQIVEMVMKRYVPPLYKALGVYLPLITTNCAVLGVTKLSTDEGDSFIEAITRSGFAGLGFLLALLMFSGVRSRLEHADIPEMFKGVPATLIAAAIVSLSFIGFGGIA